jgi:hypothetical protein
MKDEGPLLRYLQPPLTYYSCSQPASGSLSPVLLPIPKNVHVSALRPRRCALDKHHPSPASPAAAARPTRPLLRQVVPSRGNKAAPVHSGGPCPCSWASPAGYALYRSPRLSAPKALLPLVVVAGGGATGGATSHPREQIALSPCLQIWQRALPLNGAGVTASDPVAKPTTCFFFGSAGVPPPTAYRSSHQPALRD